MAASHIAGYDSPGDMRLASRGGTVTALRPGLGTVFAAAGAGPSPSTGAGGGRSSSVPAGLRRHLDMSARVTLPPGKPVPSPSGALIERASWFALGGRLICFTLSSLVPTLVFKPPSLNHILTPPILSLDCPPLSLCPCRSGTSHGLLAG